MKKRAQNTETHTYTYKQKNEKTCLFLYDSYLVNVYRLKFH